ncbi:restriction endonuclease subunit S [Streptococcus parauberis]|uniref:restriction endonuclease subunit S n=1 Tax=Streptococcus parauberis TaxID=1348 RepID=UPI0039B1071D
MAKIDDSVKKKVPELRFPGFTDDWEQRKLGDLANSFEYGLNASAKSFDGTHKYIRITDIDDSSRKFNSQSLTSPDIDLSSADNYKLKNGDILFARTGASVGKSYIYADSDGLVYYAGFLIRARIKSGVDSNFVFQHTLTSSYENFIRVTSQRSGQPGVNAKEYSTFEISVPSYEEQRKIGSFFKQLDDTIALHQRKLDLLKEQKKGYLQKMFPKNGEKVPELRFAGFADDWEERKFSDFTKLSQGLQIAISDRFTEAGPNKEFYITNEFLNPNNTKKYYIENPSKNVIANTNDILMTRTGNTGKVVTNTKGAFHNNFFKIDYDPKKISKLFLYFLLTSIPIQKEILIRAGTSTIPDLNHKDFYKIKVYLPIFEEQQRIGSFFKQLDDTIALHQRKLDLLKEQKKGFLQKMFV